MRTNATIVGVVACVVLTAWVVGGRPQLPDGRAAGSQRPDSMRLRMLSELDALEARLHATQRAIESADAADTVAPVARERVASLLTRSKVIRARVDSLGPGKRTQRAAWAGLRASIASLAYQTDVTTLAAHSDAAEFTGAFLAMIESTEARIERLSSSLDAQARLDYGARVDTLTRQLQELKQQAGPAGGSALVTPIARAERAERLAALRRELRALERPANTRRREEAGNVARRRR
jgi:hypothetical protein